MTIKDWNIEEETGYKPLTTSFMDLSIAEPFGDKAIIGTTAKLKIQYKDSYKELTELTMALNWKIWQHYGSNDRLAKLYNDLWEELDAYCIKRLKGEELEYFYRTTD